MGLSFPSSDTNSFSCSQLAVSIGNAKFNGVMEATLSAQSSPKPSSSSDMWVPPEEHWWSVLLGWDGAPTGKDGALYAGYEPPSGGGHCWEDEHAQNLGNCQSQLRPWKEAVWAGWHRYQKGLHVKRAACTLYLKKKIKISIDERGEMACCDLNDS